MAKDVNNPVNVMDLISIIYKPIMVYWYLYVLIFMYIIVSYLKWHEVNIRLLVCALILAVVTKIAHFDIGIMNNIAYYLYFFLAGGMLYQKNIIDKIQKKYLILGISLIIVNSLLYLCLQQANHTYITIKGFVLANLKSLQANLRHLTWQTQKIADGDFTQKVDFLGDFSESFNKMTLKLQNANLHLIKLNLYLVSQHLILSGSSDMSVQDLARPDIRLKTYNLVILLYESVFMIDLMARKASKQT